MNGAAQAGSHALHRSGEIFDVETPGALLHRTKKPRPPEANGVDTSIVS